VAEPREVVACSLFEAGVEIPVFRRPHLGGHLPDCRA
jgi:hypothetical protein